jgi:DNA-binding SARP family transcriptional activator/predicted Zn-dependent peptidase
MRFGLLGPVTVQPDAASAPVRIEQRMPEILLAALLLNAGKTVPTVKLTTALWGYDPPPSAASSLYNHVGRLRRLLGSEGGGRIRTASVGYVIDVESDELDTAEFVALCAEATRMREACAWAGASESFAAALSLWRGEPAEGVSGLDEWEARVQELREMHLQALDARIDSDLRLGRHRQTTAELQALALEHPLHESFHMQLMLALYRGGRQTDALNAYQKLRHSLSHDLGIDPSPAVQRIHEAILNADPQLDAFDAPSHEPVQQATVAPIAASPSLDEAADRVDREVRQTVLNGIPVLLCPALPGSRQRAGITFRVGTADEPLAREGMTHLIEHLALHRLGVTDVHHTGGTSATVTHFLMQGGANEAVEFIHSVCESLHNLPFERLETEKSILHTEASHRGHGWARHLAVSRYGARGYGMPGFGESGLPAITPDELRAWASTYFTRDNAVLWFSGDVPAGLDPRLPAGRRRPVPAPSPVLSSMPASIPGGPAGRVGLSAVVRRGPAARLFTELLERELFKRLRHEGGLSYAISADYAARDADWAEIHATADALPGTQDKLISSLTIVLSELRAGDIDPGLLEVVRSRVLEARQAPDAAAHLLPGLAADLLFGRPFSSEAELIDRFRASTADDVRAAAAEALDTALLMLPGPSPDAGSAAYPPVPTGKQTIGARIVRILVRIAFWIFLVGAVLFTALAIGMCFDKDPADDVSIGVIVFMWLFDLGVCVLPTFLLGRRLRRYKNAVGTTAVRG